MNRNDLAVPPTFSSHSGDGEPAVTPRSPKKSSPTSRKKKSVSSMVKGGTGTSDFPKAAPVLEGESVHFALPSFHARTGTRSGTWKCLGCSHENHSALSNECSVCGMTRNLSFHSNEIISESSNCDSNDSFNYDGNASENSLSLHNSFSIVDSNLGDELAHANYSFGHASLPVGLGSSMSSLTSSLPTTTRFHNSFSVEQHSRPARRNRTGRRVLNRLRGGAEMEEEEGHSSVRSFSDWNGNEKIKSWTCPTCTFVNENHLNLACDMCGHIREANDNNNDGPSVSVPPVPVITAGSTTATTTSGPATENNINTNEDDEAVLELLRAEQLRELVSLQHEIFASLDGEEAEGTRVDGSAFQTGDLDREICQIQAELYSSDHTATQRSIGLEQLEPNVAFDDDEDDEEDEEARLQELLANQMDILKDFQTGREQSPRMDKKPPISSTTVSGAGLAASSSSAISYSDPLFGGSAYNTAPQYNGAMSLKESMEAAGGKLRMEDLVVPLLWGDNISSAPKQACSAGKIQT
mmetsp:Transcript_2409/g.5117  ORF Transcript_2409/g.5117 Transcript_2409/m.5117 type:complete len:524 (-) Transcript_2409:229-1800(-)|eukprot:scaffold3821_cov173-Amphora_coffeaeformis.AAC.23